MVVRTYSFSSISEKTRKSNCCRCHYKGSTFSLVILRPWVLVRLGFEPVTSRLMDWCSPNWAYQAAVVFKAIIWIREYSTKMLSLLRVKNHYFFYERWKTMYKTGMIRLVQNKLCGIFFHLLILTTSFLCSHMIDRLLSHWQMTFSQERQEDCWKIGT